MSFMIRIAVPIICPILARYPRSHGSSKKVRDRLEYATNKIETVRLIEFLIQARGPRLNRPFLSRKIIKERFRRDSRTGVLLADTLQHTLLRCFSRTDQGRVYARSKGPSRISLRTSRVSRARLRTHFESSDMSIC